MSDLEDLELIVSSGWYLVNATSDGLFVWDLGHVSSADCKLIAGLNTDLETCPVLATSDGMGLIILVTTQ